MIIRLVLFLISFIIIIIGEAWRPMPPTWQRQRQRRGRPNQSVHLVRRFLEGVTAKKRKQIIRQLQREFQQNSFPNQRQIAHRPTEKRKKIDLEGEFWFSVLQSTGQPFFLG